MGMILLFQEVKYLVEVVRALGSMSGALNVPMLFTGTHKPI